MRNMDYEKEYKDMVQRARELHESGNALTKLQMEIVCPALAEIEDERIRKAIGAAICGTTAEAVLEANGVRLADALTYLEKQKEQNPAEYVKRNSKEWHSLLAEQWDRGFWKGKAEQSSAEWSEEDEKMRASIIMTLAGFMGSEEKISWLYSIRPQPHWKPCKEQMEGLHFTPLNRLIQKIPSKNWNDTVNNYAKKLRDCLIKEGYLKDAKVLQDYISYMNGNNVPMATMDEQEQPEVDLEKEIQIWCHNPLYELTKEQDTGKAPVKVLISDIEDTARHFYGLGLNAGKEE